MKYLKSFNEGISWNKDREEILKFCEDYLAYLKDDGFNISVRLYPTENRLYKNGIRDEGFISINKDSSLFKTDNICFKWNDIKYDLIPFLNELVKKYNLLNTPYKKLNVTFYYECKHPSELSHKKFTSDRFSDGEDINKILSGNLRSTKNINDVRITFD